MKKILLILILFLFPTLVSAAELTDKFYVDAKVDIAGSMDVQIIFVVEGPLNGYGADIGYRKTLSRPEGKINYEEDPIYGGASLTKIRAGVQKYDGNGIDFNTFNNLNLTWLTQKSTASSGEKGVYTAYDNGLMNAVKMFNPIGQEKYIFYLSYTVTDVILLHNDVAELYWNFLTADFKEDISEVKIRVLLPNADTTDYFRVWAHGNLEGKIVLLANENNELEKVGALAEINNFKAGNALDIRMTFDKSVIEVQEFSKTSNEDGFENILEVEEKRADAANEMRNTARTLYYGVFYGGIIYLIVLVCLWIYIYLKFDKEHRSDFKSKYYREFIEDYDVEVIDYLLNKSITPNAMSASIMNLIYKKNISVEEVINKKGKHEDYKFILKNTENITDNELYLTKFLFEKVGSDNTFTTKDLKSYAGASGTYSDFTTSYESWKQKVIALGVKQNFYESKGAVKFIGIIYFIVGALLTYFAYSNSIVTFIIYPVIILGTIFMIYTLTFTKRTKKGNEHYLKWQAFKNFLTDFSILPQRELPEIVLWERYMVYAVILGVAEKVQTAMNVRIQEFNQSDTFVYTPTFNMYMNLNMARAINSSVNSAIQESITKAIAESSSSSGDGFGGGFSGGGGSGGGSFGGGRF